MESAAPQPKLTCTQCGGELHADEGQMFITCPYCSATVYLDKSQVVFHWYLQPTLTQEQARSALARWMSGNQTIKDLDKKAQLVGTTFEYFPLWYFKAAAAGQKNEQILIQPAAATSISEMNRLALPAGDLRPYNSETESQSTPPSVPLEAAREWLQQRLPQSQVRESALVHVPIYLFKYQYKNQVYTALVEAATGGVLANIFPAKEEAPYLLAGAVTAAVYLCLATFPLFGSAAGGSTGSGTAAVIALVLAVIAAPILFAFAAWVASKI